MSVTKLNFLQTIISFINIAGILSYPVEQSFCRSLKYCSTSSYETVSCCNPLFLSWRDLIRFFSLSLLCSFVVARRFSVWLKYLFNSFVSALRVLLLGFKIQWTIFQFFFEFLMLEFSSKMLFWGLIFFFSFPKIYPVFFAWYVVC